jgi:hypothetical protein
MITLTPAVVIALLGLVGVQLAQIVVVARWSARIQTMVEKHEQEIGRLRDAKHDLGSRVAGIERMAELMWRRTEGTSGV